MNEKAEAVTAQAKVVADNVKAAPTSVPAIEPLKELERRCKELEKACV